MSNKKSWSFSGIFLLIAILMAVYYFIDAMWINPKGYSTPDYPEPDYGDFYAP